MRRTLVSETTTTASTAAATPRVQRKLFAVVCATLLALVLALATQFATPTAAHADQKDPYNYTVTIYGGNGAISGGDSVVFKDLAPGTSLSTSVDKANGAITIGGSSYNISLPDQKYYVKGLREVGHDALYPNSSITVDADKQFVVAYGLAKDQTQYTVNYVDEDGNMLLDSQTFFANVGDEPVVAFQYIEGYTPKNALNLTGTLNGNAAHDQFTFVYKKVDAGQGATGAEGSGSGAEGDATDDATAEGDAANGEDEDTAGADEPAELINIDDEENPLAGIDVENEQGFGLANVLPWVLAVAVAAALIAFIVLMVARKRHAKENA